MTSSAYAQLNAISGKPHKHIGRQSKRSFVYYSCFLQLLHAFTVQHFSLIYFFVQPVSSHTSAKAIAVSQSSRITWMWATGAASPLTQLNDSKCLLTTSGCRARFKLPRERGAEFLADKRDFLIYVTFAFTSNKYSGVCLTYCHECVLWVTGKEAAYARRKLSGYHRSQVCCF